MAAVAAAVPLGDTVMGRADASGAGLLNASRRSKVMGKQPVAAMPPVAPAGETTTSRLAAAGPMLSRPKEVAMASEVTFKSTAPTMVSRTHIVAPELLTAETVLVGKALLVLWHSEADA